MVIPPPTPTPQKKILKAFWRSNLSVEPSNHSSLGCQSVKAVPGRGIYTVLKGLLLYLKCCGEAKELEIAGQKPKLKTPWLFGEKEGQGRASRTGLGRLTHCSAPSFSTCACMQCCLHHIATLRIKAPAWFPAHHSHKSSLLFNPKPERMARSGLASPQDWAWLPWRAMGVRFAGHSLGSKASHVPMNQQ